MKIEKKLLPKSILELIIEEEVKNIARERTHVMEYLRNNADIKWFRKWSPIPESVIIKKYGDEYINTMVIEHSIDHLYQDALRKEKIVPISEANIVEVISQDPLKFKVHVEILPEVKVEEKYKTIKFKKTPIEVSEKEVEEALESIQTRFATFEEAGSSYAVKTWDRINIDTDWFDKDWNLLDSTSMRDYPLVIGSNMLVPGFEEWLVWKKINEVIMLDITFPKDYHNSEFAWKQTKFNVTINKIEIHNKAELTNEFIKQLRGKDLDLNWFKDLVKEEIKETKLANARMEEENQLLNELIKISTIDLWDKIIENSIKNVFNEIKENLGKDNIKVADYLDSLKLSEEEYKDKHVKDIATRRLQWELILHKLWEMEKVEVSKEEMDNEISTILSRFESADVLSRLKELYIPGNKYYEELIQRTAYRKLIDTFFE